ncbi:Pol Polyprotein [Phytophthora megakarya]|uniref:Pol Polyprotein n=1 Tax=Phytophthora megakarya TaxID=4795 RepID=A0A225VG82_9STRA|nr:Pol Polyprotein [Phytophthora megakarya]
MNLKPYELPVKQGSTPKAKRPYPIPLIHREATLREVERLVKLGILEPDKYSPWAAPAFILPKKDGSVRFLTYYRELNTRESAEKSRQYTAVVLPWGKYRYCRLPMGISTAPDEFHAVMQELLGDLPYVRVYLDDVLVLSEYFKEHPEHLTVVLKRLQDVEVIVHPEKSKLCMAQAEYLGFRISREGNEPIPGKIEAIVELERPRTIRDLRRFIGMVNYYKDMWCGRSEALAALTALTSTKRPYQWTVVEQRAFEQVKEMVTKQVLLQYPDYNIPLKSTPTPRRIHWQAKPLAFWSKKFNQAQERYTMNKKELLSIVEMLREFRTRLWGREIKVYTDHKNSVESTFRTTQILRWRLEIEEYGVTIIYTRGRENIVADALSRLPLRKEPMLAAAAKPAAEEPPEFSLSLEDVAETQ